MPDNEPSTESPLIQQRMRIAREMLEIAERHAPDHEERSALWHLSRHFGKRPGNEEAIVDAMCHLMHMAEGSGFPARLAVDAARTHFEHERGKSSDNHRLNSPGSPLENASENAPGNVTVGDALVVYCTQSGRFWNASEGWVEDPLDATCYPRASLKSISLPHARCRIAEMSHLRSLVALRDWEQLRTFDLAKNGASSVA